MFGSGDSLGELFTKLLSLMLFDDSPRNSGTGVSNSGGGLCSSNSFRTRAQGSGASRPFSRRSLHLSSSISPRLTRASCSLDVEEPGGLSSSSAEIIAEEMGNSSPEPCSPATLNQEASATANQVKRLFESLLGVLMETPKNRQLREIWEWQRERDARTGAGMSTRRRRRLLAATSFLIRGTNRMRRAQECIEGASGLEGLKELVAALSVPEIEEMSYVATGEEEEEETDRERSRDPDGGGEADG